MRRFLSAGVFLLPDFTPAFVTAASPDAGITWNARERQARLAFNGPPAARGRSATSDFSRVSQCKVDSASRSQLGCAPPYDFPAEFMQDIGRA